MSAESIKQLMESLNVEKGYSFTDQKAFAVRFREVLEAERDETCKDYGIDHYEFDELLRLMGTIPEDREREVKARKYMTANAQDEFDAEKEAKYHLYGKRYNQLQYQLHLDESKYERILRKMERSDKEAF